MVRFVLATMAAILGFLLTMPVLIVGLPFMIMAWLVIAAARRLEPPVVRWQQIYEFDALLGWKAKAHLDCHLLEERDDIFHVVTDRNGWPGRSTIAESEVVVFGDSHAWGYGTDHTNTFSQVDQSLRIKAVAAPGYNLVQEVLLMEQLSHQLKGKLVVWMVYIGNDLYDNLSPEMSGYRSPFAREARVDGGWEIVTRHLSPERWSASDSGKLRKFYAIVPALHSDTFLAQRAYGACEFLLKKGGDICRGAGAHLAVMVVPSPLALDPRAMEKVCRERSFSGRIDTDLPDRRIAAMCHERGIQFISLKQQLTAKHYKTFDDHWTDAGHRQIACVLGDMYRKWKGAP